MRARRSQRKFKKLEAQPILHQRGPEIQTFGTLVTYPIGLDEATRAASVEILGQILADTMTLRDLMLKAHWQVTGATFFQLHELFGQQHAEQVKLVDMIGERIQTLGGLAIAMSAHVAERTRIETPPPGREQVPVLISRVIDALTLVIEEARQGARRAQENGDDSTAGLLNSVVLPRNEKQVWFLSAHLADTPLVRAHDGKGGAGRDRKGAR